VNVTIRNNLVYDVSTVYGTPDNPAPARFALIGGGPQAITFGHNTVNNDGSATIYFYGDAPAGQQVAGFVLTNNLLRDNSYGVYGDKAGEGTPGLNAYTANAVVRRNTFAGAAPTQYPANNLFPTIAQWRSDFVGAASGKAGILAESMVLGGSPDAYKRDLHVIDTARPEDLRRVIVEGFIDYGHRQASTAAAPDARAAALGMPEAISSAFWPGQIRATVPIRTLLTYFVPSGRMARPSFA
jgi:hypothetical protein